MLCKSGMEEQIGQGSQLPRHLARRVTVGTGENPAIYGYSEAFADQQNLTYTHRISAEEHNLEDFSITYAKLSNGFHSYGIHYYSHSEEGGGGANFPCPISKTLHI